MTAPRIKREVARESGHVRYVYSFCPACSSWYAFAWTLTAAYEQGEAHLMNVHDVSQEAISNVRRNREAARARHAVSS